MKIPSSFLYDLVKKLSKSEKRYIKVQAGNSEKDYLQLFDALLSLKVFDEQQLIEKNKGTKFLKHLAVNKRYLYELILRSLANYKQEEIEEKVLARISAAKILIEKGMPDAAYGELKKGEKLVKKFELYELEIMLLGIKKQIFTYRKFMSESTEAIHQIYKVESNCLEQLKNTSEYWYLSRQISQFLKLYQKIQNDEQENYLNELTKNPLFKDIGNASNFRSKLFFFEANAAYQFIKGNIEKAYEYNNGFLDLLDDHPHFLNLYAERYLSTLNNMLIDSLMIGKYEKLEDGIDRLTQTVSRKAFKSVKNIDARVFRQQYLLLFNWSIRQKDFKKALAWIQEVELGLNKFGKKIEKHHRVTFYYLASYLSFLNKEYKQALNWNLQILNDPKENVVKEIFYFSRVLNMLIHFELDNEKLLDSLLTSVPKYLRRRRELYNTEKILFLFLRKMLNSINRKEKAVLFDEFETTIDDLATKKSESRVFNYLDLRLWLEYR